MLQPPDGLALWQAPELVQVHEQLTKCLVCHSDREKHIHILNFVVETLWVRVWILDLCYRINEAYWLVHIEATQMGNTHLGLSKESYLLPFATWGTGLHSNSKLSQPLKLSASISEYLESDLIRSRCIVDFKLADLCIDILSKLVDVTPL